MTKDEIKKAYGLCASANDCSSCNDCPDCANCASAAALNLITEQEQEIEKKGQIIENLNGLIDYADKEIGKLKAENKMRLNTAQDQILETAQQNQEYREQQVKQAKIDVLCKLKQRSWCDNFFADGKWHRYVFVNDIDELIEEVGNDK